METKKPVGSKFGWKKLLKTCWPYRKTDSSLKKATKGESSSVVGNFPSCSQSDVIPNVRWTSYKEDVIDIHEVDKDRIRTTCKEALENPPAFPSREEVKEKIENAHKYYGVKCMHNFEDSDDPTDRKELQPNWYYILERPLVEQYVLMNNYIRKLSVMASLKKEQSGVEEESAVEEEVSSISSLSDYEDFAPDSKIAATLKELKNRRAKDPLPSHIGVSKLEQELSKFKRSAKTEESTIKTNEYTIIIREPAKLDVEQKPASYAIEFGEYDAFQEQITEETKRSNCSGDHLPDMKDFDLSYNGRVEMKTGHGGPSYYHWQGNSTPTKTALLNMDCQPPVRPRAPGTARDFLSFRNLSLSSEFLDSCRDYTVAFAEECRNDNLKELAGPSDHDDDLDDGCVNLAYQTEQKNGKHVLSLTWEQPTTTCCLSVDNSIADTAEGNTIVKRGLASDDQQCGDQTTDVERINSDNASVCDDRIS